MKIKHIEKSTFVDFPDKMACTIFLHGCPFRCGFCYNPSLVIREETPDLQRESILDFLRTRIGLLEGVCFTGGEPLMTLDEKFLEEIKKMGFAIKIDTNGSYPEKLKKIIEKGLVDYVAMDVKIDKENYKRIINLNFPLEKIEESIKIISELPNYEFRTTIIEKEHTQEIVEKMLEWISELIKGKIKNFSLQGFKNKGDFIDNKFREEKNTTEEYLKKISEVARNYVENLEVKM